MSPRGTVRTAATTALVLAAGLAVAVHAEAQAALAPVAGLDLTSGNRRAPIAGLPDWSRAGYRGTGALPGSGDINPAATCNLTPAVLAGTYQVRPNDNPDDSTGLQAAIDAVKASCSPSASYTKLSLITLPAGMLNVARQLSVDADYLIVRGAGASTRLVFRPDAGTRYDALTPDGSDWDEDGMTAGDAYGVDATRTDPGPSLFLRSVPGSPPVTTSPIPSVSPPVTTSPPAPGGLSAAFAKTSTWTGGYGADYVIRNGGAVAVTGWTVEFDLPAGSRVSSSWNATRTDSGQHHRFTNVSWNGSIAPGATRSFGLNVAGAGTPVNCTVNGAPC